MKEKLLVLEGEIIKEKGSYVKIFFIIASLMYYEEFRKLCSEWEKKLVKIMLFKNQSKTKI